jgi:hypothetical protein
MVPTKTAGKQTNGVRGSRPRRTLPLDEAAQLRERGLSIRSVAAKIRFPPSTVAAALEVHSAAQAELINVGPVAPRGLTPVAVLFDRFVPAPLQ